MTEKSDERPKLHHDEVVALCGDIVDAKVQAIIRSGATHEDLAEAVAWSTGEDDVMGEERKQLSGRVARLYDILTRDEEDPDAAYPRG